MKLALIGKNISHSQSQAIYENLLNKEVEYTLIDISSFKELPTLEFVFNNYNLDGLSITSPYKRSYLDQIENKQDNHFINTVKKVGDLFYGHNTDLTAFYKQMKIFKERFRNMHFIILGDGVMASMVHDELNNLNISFDQYSRKMNNNFDSLAFHNIPEVDKTILVNCCSRDFHFNQKIEDSILFWDLNYNHQYNKQFLSNRVEYIDGQNFLKDQAIEALSIWFNN